MEEAFSSIILKTAESSPVIALLFGVIIYLHHQVCYWRDRYAELLTKFKEALDSEIAFYRGRNRD